MAHASRLGWMGLVAATLAAAPASGQGASDTGAALACPVPGGAPQVIAHRDLAAGGGRLETTTWTEMHRSVLVVVCNLAAWSKTNDVQGLRLYLAGHVIPASRPILINRTQEYVIFKLTIDPSDRALWVDVLAEARHAKDHRVPVSVGSATEPFVSNQYVKLNVYPRWTVCVVVFLVALLIGLLALARYSDLLRASPAIADRSAARPPFSLAYVQMAWWFYLVVAAYLYIWLLTAEHNTLTDSVLALIGISAVTGLGAVFVDREKVTSVLEQRRALEANKAFLEQRIGELEAAAPPAGSAAATELGQKRAELQKAAVDLAALPPPPAVSPSRGWVRDLLSDGTGLSFHRFQMAIWTIVLGAIFVRSVYADLAMPTLSATLLGLMGLSSGTYLGFKFPEKPK